MTIDLATRAALVTADFASLRKCDKAWLVAEYRRAHRVCDTREMGKMDLVYGILRDRHGSKAVAAANV